MVFQTSHRSSVAQKATATQMAEGARRALHATFGVSTTGIAGPSGGTARKPVGLVYIGVSGPAGTTAEEHHFSGDRAQVIESATMRALDMLVEHVKVSLGE